ncbi:MAG: alpha/beta hydrolase family protein [Bullifex sp.]
MQQTEHFDKYYTTIENMISRMERSYRLSGYRGSYKKDDFLTWQKDAREKLRQLLGMPLIEIEAESVPFSPVLKEEILTDGNIRRQRILITVDKDVVIPMFILYPENPKGTWIALPGHNGGGKATVAGDVSCEAVKEKIVHYGYDYGLEMAERGYITICPDSRGFGERREEFMQGDESEKYLKSSCASLAHVATALGFSLMGLLVYDISRIIDYLEERDDIPTDPLGVIGFSGGAMQALYASAIDTRITRTILSGYFYGFRDSLVVLNGNCACNYPHGVFRHFDMCDLAGMIAPRPLAIQACLEDHLEGRRGIINTMEQLEEARRMYGIFGRDIFLDTPPGDHSFHKEGLDAMLASL